MSQGITFTINAETAEAAARVTEFFKSAGEGFEKLSGAGDFLSEIGGKIAAAFTVGAIVEFTREAINSAEQMGKLAQKTGQTIQTLNGLREQAHQLGISFEEVGTTMGIFSDKTFAAVRMGGQAGQVFRDLGIRLLDSTGRLKSMGDLLSEVAEKFKGMPDGPNKTAAAMDLFGRSGRELIPILNQGSEGMERMRMEGGGITPEMVREATEFNRVLRELTEDFENIGRRLVMQVVPSLKEFVEWLRAGVLAAEVGRFGEFFELSMKVAIQNISNFMLSEMAKWSQKMEEMGKVSAGSVASHVGHGMAGLASGLLFIADTFGNKMGFVSDKQLFDRFETTEDQFKKAGFEDTSKGILGMIADNKTNGPTNKYAAALEKLKEDMKQDAERLRASQGAGTMVNDAMAATMRALGLGSDGAGGGAAVPPSEEAKNLIKEIDRAWAESTKSKKALLDIEEAQLKEKIDKEILNVTLAEEEKLKVTQIYAAKRTELEKKAADERAQIELAKIQGQRKLIEADQFQSEEQKRPQMIALLEQENQALQRNIALNQQRLLSGKLSAEAELATRKELSDLSLRQAKVQQESKGLTTYGNVGSEFKLAMVELQNEGGRLADNFKSVFHSAFSSISNGITGLIMQTKTWGQALTEIGTTIVTSIVQAIVQMGLRWVMTQIMMALFGQSLMASSLAAMAPMAAAASGIWAAPATLSAIASYGASAAAAPAEILAAQGIVAAQSIAAFEEGGFTGPGGRSQLAGMVHKGEYVFSAPAVQAIGVANLDAMHGAAVGRGSNGTSNVSNKINIGFLNDRSEVPHWARSQQGENHIVDVVRRNWHRIQ